MRRVANTGRRSDLLWKASHHQAAGTQHLNWLTKELKRRRGRSRNTVQRLINDIPPKLDRTDYPDYRERQWQIGTGMIESTAKQLVGQRLKGPGMHWSPPGATAITALRN